MKTLVDLDIQPEVGMIVYSLKGRYKHHIIEFGNRFDHYDNNKAVYCKYVHTIGEKGSTSWIEYNHFVSNYSYVGMCINRLSDLFKDSSKYTDKVTQIDRMINDIKEALKR